MKEITKEQWYSHPSFRQDLEKLLDDPVFEIALSIVSRKGADSTSFIAGQNLIHFFALMGAKKDGYYEALKNLKQLAKPEPNKTPTPKAWETPSQPTEQPKK